MANERFQLPLVALRDRLVFPNISTGFDVGRTATLYAVKYANEADRLVFVCAQTDSSKDSPLPEDLYDVGTIARIERVAPLGSDRIRVTCRGLFRARSLSVYEQDGSLYATVEKMGCERGEPMLEEAYFRTARTMVTDLAAAGSRISREVSARIESCADAEQFIYLTLDGLQLKYTDQQAIYSREKLIDMFYDLDKQLNSELEISRLERKIQGAVRQSIEKNQREYYLREQLKAIHAELGDSEDVLRTFTDYQDETDVRFVKVVVGETHPWAGKKLRACVMPREFLVVLILRGEEVVVPGGDTVVYPGDLLVTAAPEFENHDEFGMFEEYLGEDHPWAGKTVRELQLPDGTLIAMIKRGGGTVIPYGATELKAGDTLVCIKLTEKEHAKSAAH